MEGQPPKEQTQEQATVRPVEAVRHLGQQAITKMAYLEANADEEIAEQEPAVVPRIYVADLAAYNAGVLRGVWLEAAQDVEDLEEAIAGMLAHSPGGRHEEWAIHDFEGFNGLHLGEWENLTHVSKVAKGIEAKGLAYAHWATLVATDEELDQFEDAYLGHWADLKSYAEDVLEDLGAYEQVEKAVSEHLRPYVTIDTEGFARDLELGGDVLTAEGEGGIYVYRH